MNSEIFQRSGKDICGSIGKLLRLIVGIRKMVDDVQLSELATYILHVLADQVLATYFTIRNLRISSVTNELTARNSIKPPATNP
jgi:hypothetical protein